MSAIEAATGRVRTLVDGTLRLEVDIEPRHAQDAFKLFASPGTRVALAALKADATTAEPKQTQPEPAKRAIGPICTWLVMRCREPEFRQWAYERSAHGTEEIDAADWCRSRCGVKSRADIDGWPKAETLFEEQIRKPWLAHQKRSGSTKT